MKGEERRAGRGEESSAEQQSRGEQRGAAQHPSEEAAGLSLWPLPKGQGLYGHAWRRSRRARPQGTACPSSISYSISFNTPRRAHPRHREGPSVLGMVRATTTVLPPLWSVLPPRLLEPIRATTSSSCCCCYHRDCSSPSVLPPRWSVLRAATTMVRATTTVLPPRWSVLPPRLLEPFRAIPDSPSGVLVPIRA
jgi:hypothetical protein